MADKTQTDDTATAPAPAPAMDTKQETTTTTTNGAPAAAAASQAESTPPTSIDVDKSRPEDFEGNVDTNDELPSAELLAKIQDYVLLDRDGKTHTFKSLYNGPNVARRVLVLFVRHFFCSLCQEYLQIVCENVKPDALLQLPVSTFVVVIGCGDPGLIDQYREITQCPFPMYVDPNRQLYLELGMTQKWSAGSKPAYQRMTMGQSIVKGLKQGLGHLTTGLATKSGNKAQVGGEFLFEPLELWTPVNTPGEGADATGATGIESFESRVGHSDAEPSREEKKVTWCHRMRNTRDHTEIPQLLDILGLDGKGQPIKDAARWAKAQDTRKGTGESMAGKMEEKAAVQAQGEAVAA